jgi:hypothetical protein
MGIDEREAHNLLRELSRKTMMTGRERRELLKDGKVLRKEAKRERTGTIYCRTEQGDCSATYWQLVERRRVSSWRPNQGILQDRLSLSKGAYTIIGSLNNTEESQLTADIWETSKCTFSYFMRTPRSSKCKNMLVDANPQTHQLPPDASHFTT